MDLLERLRAMHCIMDSTMMPNGIGDSPGFSLAGPNMAAAAMVEGQIRELLANTGDAELRAAHLQAAGQASDQPTRVEAELIAEEMKRRALQTGL